LAVAVFVLSLPGATARRDSVATQLVRLRLPHEIVDACDGTALVVSGSVPGADTATFGPQPLLGGRPLTPAEIGCVVSHLTLWRRIAETTSPAVVLEDDVRVAPMLVEVLDRIKGTTPPWDVLLLGHHSTRARPDVGAAITRGGMRLSGGRRIAALAEFPMGAFGYLVTPRGAARLARFATPIRMPADWVTGYSPVAGVRLHGLAPPCVTPDPRFETTIVDRERLRLPRARRGGLGAALARARDRVGEGWLWLRRWGVFPAGYTWPYAAAVQPRRGRTTTA
jgi:glycosyl transferase family 25